MAIEVALSGGGTFDGAASAINSYSVTEESTPTALGDTSGGTGQVSFDALDDPSRLGSNLLLGTNVTLSDMPPQINLVYGSDFESAAGTPWDLSGTTEWVRQSGVATSGTWRLRGMPGTGTTAVPLKYTIPVTPGEVLYFELQVRRDDLFDGTGDNSKLRVASQTGVFLTDLSYGLEDMPLSATWYKRTKTFTIPRDIRALTVTLSKNNLNGNVYLDDIIIRRATLPLENRGVITGTVNNLNGSGGGLLSVSGDSALARLVARRNANSVNGTLQTALTYYFGLCGITSGFTIDPTIAAKTVVAPGWFSQDMYTKIKELLALNGAEIALTEAGIVVRPTRTIEVDPRLNAEPVTWTASVGELQQKVTVNYYNNQYRNNFLVVPEGGWSPEARVLQVEAGETVEENLPVNMWVDSVQQPTLMTQVPRSHVSSSAYSIVGSDGFPITAAQWTAHGGKMSFSIGEDRTSINVSLTGPRVETATAKYGPFRVAVSSGTEYYSTLRICATGVYFLEESVEIATGVAPDVGTDDGVTISSGFVATKAQALAAGMGAARMAGGAVRTVTFRTNGFKSVNTTPQTFGYVAGSRVRWRRGIYRVRSASITESSVEFTAEADTTFADFKASASGMTFAQFNAAYSGLTFGDFAQIPLPVVKAEYDQS